MANNLVIKTEKAFDSSLRAQVTGRERAVPVSIANGAQCKLVNCARRCVCVYMQAVSDFVVVVKH